MEVNSRKLSESIASAVRTSEQEILQNRIARLLKLGGPTVEIDPPLVQVGNVICDVMSAHRTIRTRAGE